MLTPPQRAGRAAKVAALPRDPPGPGGAIADERSVADAQRPSRRLNAENSIEKTARYLR